MELESTMGYLTNGLKVSLENAELLIVHELVQAPSIGEITRQGYVSGWKIPGQVFSALNTITVNTNFGLE